MVWQSEHSAEKIVVVMTQSFGCFIASQATADLGRLLE